MSGTSRDWASDYHNWVNGHRERNSVPIRDEDKRYRNGKLEIRIAAKGNWSEWEDYEGNREWDRDGGT